MFSNPDDHAQEVGQPSNTVYQEAAPKKDNTIMEGVQTATNQLGKQAGEAVGKAVLSTTGKTVARAAAKRAGQTVADVAPDVLTSSTPGAASTGASTGSGAASTASSLGTAAAGAGITIGGAVGKALISDGMQTSTGDNIATAANLVGTGVSFIPGVGWWVGPAISAVGNIVGGVVNAGWGHKVFGKAQA